jgi:CRISPR-associated endonuclease/helicase Cas3
MIQTGAMTENLIRLLRCWGKTDPTSEDPQSFHPALYHMLDTGNVARILLSEQCSPRWTSVFSRVYETDSKTLNSFIPFFVAMHDIGKVSASFQRVNPGQAQRMRYEGFQFGRSRDLYHTQVSRNFIRYEWPEDMRASLSDVNRRVLGEMSAGHHGEFISAGEMNSIKLKLRLEEPPIWMELRRTTLHVLAEHLLFIAFSEIPIPQNISSAAMQLTGFTTICDWIGSDQRFFQPRPDLDLEGYLEFSRKLAEQAVQQDGFTISFAQDNPTSFCGLFRSLDPRPLQLAVDDIPDEVLLEPALFVIEAPTGEGKTEAALALAHRITALKGFDEFYYALPTTATSNQMHKRVVKYLKEQLNIDSRAKLIHGQAFLQQEAVGLNPLSNGSDTAKDHVSIDWFNTKKRALLAPFGVGTIDQIELGALNVRHASLRLTGLAGKVVILDEVHAYDTYMTTIITRLLEWLHSLGASVILLSATLPAGRRKILLDTYNAHSDAGNDHTEYPLILAANSRTVFKSTPAPSQPCREIGLMYLRFTDKQNAEKARWLLEQITDGGVVCWITNTVDRAQEIYREILNLADSDVEVALIHARFPLIQREAIEERIVEKAGPDKNARPRKMIVIGTQVLEQSLDLDFDLMVSDLAPIDLLLQRAGRLHRHSEMVSRGQHMFPVLWINLPMNDGLPVIKIDKYVYAEYFLLRTWDILKDRTKIMLPGDYRELIEQVYGESSGDMLEAIQKALIELKKQEELARQEAVQRLLPKPDPEDLFTSIAARMVFTESETKAGWTVAQTRLGERSVNIIPLEDHGDYCTLPGSDKPIHKSLPASREDQFLMLRHQVRISRTDLVNALDRQSQHLPGLFTGSPLLRDVLPLWLHMGVASVTTDKHVFELVLDPQLGLRFNRKGG